MENPTLKAKIVKIEPSSGYEGKIYDQYVFIELPDGKILDIFDFQMIANPQMVNKVKNITISVSLASVEKLSKPKFGIVPYEMYAEYKPSGHGHAFYGKIEEIDEKKCEIVVDTGAGKVLVTPERNQLEEFSTGDFLRVLAVRADLISIQD
ncbi:MAG: hypothetical protein M5U10_17760 [Candidatus Methanoperedens sp.]|nr:hypothetical protein [Candidatus Methanoperedens sp.]